MELTDAADWVLSGEDPGQVYDARAYDQDLAFLQAMEERDIVTGYIGVDPELVREVSDAKFLHKLPWRQFWITAPWRMLPEELIRAVARADGLTARAEAILDDPRWFVEGDRFLEWWPRAAGVDDPNLVDAAMRHLALSAVMSRARAALFARGLLAARFVVPPVARDGGVTSEQVREAISAFFSPGEELDQDDDAPSFRIRRAVVEGLPDADNLGRLVQEAPFLTRSAIAGLRILYSVPDDAEFNANVAVWDLRPATEAVEFIRAYVDTAVVVALLLVAAKGDLADLADLADDALDQAFELGELWPQFPNVYPVATKAPSAATGRDAGSREPLTAKLAAMFPTARVEAASRRVTANTPERRRLYEAELAETLAQIKLDLVPGDNAPPWTARHARALGVILDRVGDALTTYYTQRGAPGSARPALDAVTAIAVTAFEEFSPLSMRAQSRTGSGVMFIDYVRCAVTALRVLAAPVRRARDFLPVYSAAIATLRVVWPYAELVLHFGDKVDIPALDRLARETPGGSSEGIRKVLRAQGMDFISGTVVDAVDEARDPEDWVPPEGVMMDIDEAVPRRSRRVAGEPAVDPALYAMEIEGGAVPASRVGDIEGHRLDAIARALESGDDRADYAYLRGMAGFAPMNVDDAARVADTLKRAREGDDDERERAAKRSSPDLDTTEEPEGGAAARALRRSSRIRARRERE